MATVMTPDRRNKLTVLVLGAVVLVIGVWVRTKGVELPGLGHRTGVLQQARRDGGTRDGTDGGASGEAGVMAPQRGVLTSTVHDRALRDDLRRRLFAAWASQFGTDPDATVTDPLYAPMPTLPDGRVDPDYIRERIRDDFVPMARGCFDELLVRYANVQGTVIVRFTVLGDETIGGVVDDVAVDPGDGGLSDPEFVTCLSESLMAVAFRPPAGRGSLRVTYPFRFRPSDGDGGEHDGGARETGPE